MPPPSRETLLRQMLRIRLVEEKIIELYPSDKIQSPVHLSIGQEAAAVGVCAALRADDLFFPTYRGHASYLAKGGDLKAFFAELYGKATGVAGGKAGSMHLLAPEVGFMPASAVVASIIPLALGAALMEKRRGGDRAIVANFGDGATEEGAHHESLNLAAKLRLPVIFLCEDNGYAVHASLMERQAYRIADLPGQYGVETTEIDDGHDPERVFEMFRAVVDGIRLDRRPRYVVVRTHRAREHVGPGDDSTASYRSRVDVDRWRALDPLINDPGLVASLAPPIRREIEDAVAFAEVSPWPDPHGLLEHVT